MPSVILFLLFACSTVLAVPQRAGADFLTGFRDINWGDSRDKHPDVTGFYNGYHLAGERNNDPGVWINLKLWDEQGPWFSGSFCYHFDREFGFYAANAVFAAGISDSDLKECFDQMITMLGQPTEREKLGGEDDLLIWKGEKVVVEFYINNRNRRELLSGRIIITHIPLESKVKDRNKRKSEIGF